MSIESDLVQYYWIDGELNTFYLSPSIANERYMIEINGLGLPGVERFVSKRAYDHGQSKRGWRYTARPIEIVLGFRSLTPSALWTDMADWASAFNMERGMGTLKMVLQDGTERRIDCEVNDSIPLGSQDRPSGRVQIVSVSLMADDPMLYDPVMQKATSAFSGSTDVDVECDNDGDVATYPVIEISGAVTNPLIELIIGGIDLWCSADSEIWGTTDSELWAMPEYEDAELDIDHTLAGTDVMIIDFEAASVTINGSTNGMRYVTKASDFFKLKRGSNTIQLAADSGTATVEIRWMHKYVALHA